MGTQDVLVGLDRWIERLVSHARCYRGILDIFDVTSIVCSQYYWYATPANDSDEHLR